MDRTQIDFVADERPIPYAVRESALAELELATQLICTGVHVTFLPESQARTASGVSRDLPARSHSAKFNGLRITPGQYHPQWVSNRII